MEEYVLLKKSTEIEKLAAELGFSSVKFLDADFVVLKARTKKDALKEIQHAKQKKLKTIYKADSEDMLRFMLEKTEVDIVFAMENIHPKDSTHFVRGGLDQVLCTLAATKRKTLAFSFSEMLHSVHKGKLLGRMIFNIKLCKKYKVPIKLVSFALSKEEMRSAKDLQALGRVLGF